MKMAYWYNAVNNVEMFRFTENTLYLAWCRCCSNLAEDAQTAHSGRFCIMEKFGQGVT
jgi:hypothetical protein